MPSAQHGTQFMSRNWLALVIGAILTSLLLFSFWRPISFHTDPNPPGGDHGKSSTSNGSNCQSSGPVDLAWHPPVQSSVNNLDKVINGSGVHGFIFNSSMTPAAVPYSTYNYCNMPRVRAEEYQVPNPDFELAYVELIHRHHKRTPYATNTFPHEAESWDCTDSNLYYYARPGNDNDHNAAQINWQITLSISNINPFPIHGFRNSTCQFPQITSAGLLDSRQHGADLRSVYIDLLHFLSATYDPEQVKFRVTHNVITSQVASQVAIGLFPSLTNQSVPVQLQPKEIDSLEPSYPCPRAKELYASHGVGSTDPAWLAHLSHPKTQALLARLDELSGVDASNRDWHVWFDHYFDNISSKLCHGKSLAVTTGNCHPSSFSSSSSSNGSGNQDCEIDKDTATTVLRHGLYEYSYLHRDHRSSLQAATASFGVWLAELASHIRETISQHSSLTSNPGDEKHKPKHVLYRHNIAHDGSIARLLSILQVDVMVWPGMGSEVVFELWRGRRSGCWFVRILWKGEVLRSCSPALRREEGEDGEVGMLPVQRFLRYVDGLIGVNGEKIIGLCGVEV